MHIYVLIVNTCRALYSYNIHFNIYNCPKCHFYTPMHTHAHMAAYLAMAHKLSTCMNRYLVASYIAVKFRYSWILMINNYDS